MSGNPSAPDFQGDDDLVQLLTTARYALELGRTEQAADAIDQALAAVRRRATGRAGQAPGDLVRRSPDD